MIEALAFVFLGLISIYLVLGIDDLFIDLVFWFKKLGPQNLTEQIIVDLKNKKQKSIAIMIAGWQEDDVLEAMIVGNNANIDYTNHHFFLGVYPNDPKTISVARSLENKFRNVTVVVNEKNGPTSKGQMLNQMVRDILLSELKTGLRFDLFAIHDAEDLIHSKSLLCINQLSNQADFIQIPIFSLPLSPWSLVGGTYIDEFAEIHTKDILVREALKATIPSAGVGTFMSRRLVLSQMIKFGRLLNPKSVTEDYELGVGLEGTSFRSAFGYFKLDKNEVVATREYFPKIFWRSVRQKTRWTLGIAFQGTKNLGWAGRKIHKYFLFRDRKGPLANISVLIGLLFVVSVGLLGLENEHIWEDIFHSIEGFGFSYEFITVLMSFCFFLMLNRIVQRVICTKRVYGTQLAALIPIRLFVANVINALAAVRSIKEFLVSEITGKAPKWVKTAHELPKNFGVVPFSVEDTKNFKQTENTSIETEVVSRV